MSRKKKINLPERHSFVDEKGRRWLQCRHCYEYVEVDEPVGAITCSSCVVRIDITKYPETAFPKRKVSTGRPPGWHWMSEFVDKDGNVFHKGKEQPKLKGTLPPTKVKPRKKKKKLSADEKLFKKAADWKKRLKAKRGKK